MSNEQDVISILNTLITTGIQVDKNLRQPSYYSAISFDELKNELNFIITDLLTNQRVPFWLSQRIAWYYSNKFFQEIVTDLSLSNQNGDHEFEAKNFTREKLLIYLRNAIPCLIKEWLNERANLSNQKIESLIFSINRTEKNSHNNVIFYEFGLRNKRRTMEDRTSIYENIDLFNNYFLSDSRVLVKKSNALFGVFDGHCGSDCAQYVSTHLPLNIIQHNDFKDKIDSNSNLESVFKETFELVNKKFLDKALNENLRSGCTGCVVVLSTTNKMGDKYTKLSVGWCGDTQFCLVKNGQMTFITQVHKPEIESEKLRIKSCGGNVAFQSGTWRINGSLSVSRSFGDIDFHSSGVSSEPEVKEFDLDGTEDYFIIACDGFWESVKIDDLTKIVNENLSSHNIAECLVKLAKENGSSDNISVIFVVLKDSIDQITKA